MSETATPLAYAQRIVDPALSGEHPQDWYAAKLRLGIEAAGDGLVAVRRMADILELNRARQVITGNSVDVPNRPRGGILGLGGHYVAIPLALDGAEHTKWRRLLDPLFTPKKVAALEDRVRARAVELLDRIYDTHAVDVYKEWCEPLPSSIFLSIMGIPAEELTHFLGFKNVILSAGQTVQPTLAEREAAFTDCEAWFSAEFDRREKAGDYGEDVIGWLLTVEVEGRRIAREELLGICNLFMIAGLDTVAASLACILAHLARHPERRQAVLDNPALWPTAIEELMRFESPVTGGSRFALEEVELPSGTIGGSTLANVSWSAANLDPEFFPEPLEVRLDRSPNPHIAFASGFHRCLGSHLARMELRAALQEWHRRIPHYDVAPGTTLTYSGNPRTPRPLPLVW